MANAFWFCSLGSVVSLVRALDSQAIEYGDAEPHVYGKYFFLAPQGPGLSGPWTREDYNDNLMSFYRSTVTTVASPLIMQFPGVGWMGNGGNYDHINAPTPAIKQYMADGFSFAAIQYRTFNRDYSYHDGDVTKLEEFIHVGRNGTMWLDTNGRTMKEYKLRASALELIPKVLYDTSQCMEYVIAHAAELNVDVHRIIFIGSSAGSIEANYLSFVYHASNVKRYSPIGLVQTNPQFNLPLFQANAEVWDSFANHTVPGTLLKDLFSFDHCSRWLTCGDTYSPIATGCNSTADQWIRQKVCSSEEKFNSITLAQMREFQSWTPSDPEYAANLRSLWSASTYMVRHQPKPFHIFATKSGVMVNVLHHSMFVQQYGEVADLTGMNYTIYFLKYKDIRPDWTKHFPRAVEKAELTPYSYASSVPWRVLPGVQDCEKGGILTDNFGWFVHHHLFICYVADMGCSPKNPVSVGKYSSTEQAHSISNQARVISTPMVCSFMVGFSILLLAAYRVVKSKPSCKPTSTTGDESELELE